jgi:hypothetical protein
MDSPGARGWQRDRAGWLYDRFGFFRCNVNQHWRAIDDFSGQHSDTCSKSDDSHPESITGSGTGYDDTDARRHYGPFVFS